jgi:hypothetical protein
VIYSFGSGVWGSLDGTYFAGGRTTLDDTLMNDLQQNWRVGATLAFPINVRNSIKLYGSSGVSARTGNSFDLLGIAWQNRWGGGLRSSIVPTGTRCRDGRTMLRTRPQPRRARPPDTVSRWLMSGAGVT